MGNIQTIPLGGKITGQHRMTGLSSARPVAGTGNCMILQAETQNVRIKFGSAPTTTDGLLLTAGVVYQIQLGPEQSIQDFQAIEVQASAVLNVIAISTK